MAAGRRIPTFVVNAKRRSRRNLMSTVTATVPVASSIGVNRARVAIVAVVLTVAAIALAVTVLWQPWGERDALGYADLAPHRDAAWLGALIDGLSFAALGITLGIAVCLLAPARGAVLANVGAVLTGFGGLAFCAGMVSFGSFAWYATNTDAISVESGTALMTYIENNPAHILGPQMAGFLLATLGSLVLMGALWRARAVPRWLPIAYLVLTIGVFATDGVVLNVIQAAQTLLVIPVAYYAYRTAA
jgi:hypothetical protein